MGRSSANLSKQMGLIQKASLAVGGAVVAGIGVSVKKAYAAFLRILSRNPSQEYIRWLLNRRLHTITELQRFDNIPKPSVFSPCDNAEIRTASTLIPYPSLRKLALGLTELL